MVLTDQLYLILFVVQQAGLVSMSRVRTLRQLIVPQVVVTRQQAIKARPILLGTDIELEGRAHCLQVNNKIIYLAHMMGIQKLWERSGDEKQAVN